MRNANEFELVELWEDGQSRHPIDRALLLCAWARPELGTEQFAQLPIGVINAELLKLRATLFGHRLELHVACSHCGELLEMVLEIDELLSQVRVPETPAEIEVSGFCFRLPNSRDLAAIAYDPDAEMAALRLLEGCCLSRPGGGEINDSLLSQVDVHFETADPMADPSFDVVCPDCGQHTDAMLDPGALLWSELQSYALSLLGQVHCLASAYGWTEREVLALSSSRRKSYLSMIDRG